MNDFDIKANSKKEIQWVDDNLVAFNNAKVPFTQENPFIQLSYHITGDDGQIIAGIHSTLACWGILSISMVFVDENNRHKKLASVLLQKVEEEAKKQGGYIALLDTGDFQAKDFYLKRGYEVHSTLENCPPGHVTYKMKKLL